MTSFESNKGKIKPNQEEKGEGFNLQNSVQTARFALISIVLT